MGEVEDDGSSRHDASARREASHSSGHRVLRWLVLAILPLCLALVCHELTIARGPFYLFAYDPDYAYLFNALNLTQSFPPGHVDHPGVPVDVLGACVIRVQSAGAPDVVEDVLAHPETYLQRLSLVLMGIILLALTVLPALVLWRTGRLGPALALQATPFMLGRSLPEIVRFNPEPLMLSIAFMLGGLLFLHAQGRARYGCCMAAAVGALVATGIAAKITFLPLIVLPLLVLSRWRERWIYSLTSALGLGLWLVPISAHLGVFQGLVHRLVTRQGRYAAGPEGVLPPHYLANLLDLAARDLWLSGSIVMIAVVLWKSRGRPQPDAPRLLRRLLLGIALAQTAQLLMVAKAPEPRYLLPAEALTGVGLAAIVMLHERRRRQGAGLISSRTAVWLVATLSVAATATVYAVWAQKRTEGQGQRKVADIIARDLRGQTVILGYRSPSPAYALVFGNVFAHWHYTEQLKEVLPHREGSLLFMDNWSGKISTLSGIVPIEKVLAMPGPLFWVGDASVEQSVFSRLPRDRRPKPWVEGGGQTIYRSARP